MVFFQLATFSRCNAIINHVTLMMMMNHVAVRKDQYPLYFIYIYIYTNTRSDVNVTENKEANDCHHH